MTFLAAGRISLMTADVTDALCLDIFDEYPDARVSGLMHRVPLFAGCVLPEHTAGAIWAVLAAQFPENMMKILRVQVFSRDLPVAHLVGHTHSARVSGAKRRCGGQEHHNGIAPHS